ncbi:hypothetical protein NIES4071_35350 [Calothrix sp. NIES-4071]|nr:hypothetical protein NIES4071_35350 [Calothrix sp. NIES-4071]BAZ57854.1 hypothetical protein NIES4105_35280 [Calothrix sp. NIES-4105]
MTNTKSPTPEQLQRWAKLDELESTAFAGKEISRQKFNSLVQAMLDGSNLIKHLAEIRERRQNSIKEAAELEEYEKWLENHIKDTLGEVRH